MPSSPGKSRTWVGHSLFLATGYQKYGECPVFTVGAHFDYFCRRAIPDIVKSCLGDIPPQHCPIEPWVEYTIIILMKPPIIRIQVSYAEVSARSTYPMKLF